MITRPILGEMTQGVVFAGAFADNYRNAPVWGICITARCDAAHDKAQVFNYLPIVRFEDWLVVDGTSATLRSTTRRLHYLRGKSAATKEALPKCVGFLSS